MMNSLLKFLIISSLLVFLIPAHLYRVVYFNIIVEISAFVYLWLLVRNRIKPPKLSLVGAAFFIFIVVSVLATIFSVEPIKSFWGTPVRSLMGGLFMYLHYFVFFVVLAGAFEGKEDYLRLFRIIVPIGIILSAWGIYQRSTGLPRIDSLMGNPTYLSSFLIFSSFLSAYLLSVSARKRLKFIYLGVMTVFLVIIYLALSRGPIIGLFVSAALASVILLVNIIKKNYKNSLKIILPIFICVIAIIYLSVPAINDSVLFGRFKTSLSDASATTRIANWKIALKAIIEKPIFGWGQENFDLAFYKYSDSSKFLSDNLDLTWFDRAHNNILDIGVAIGIFGLIAYVFIWIAVAWTLLYLFKRGNRKEVVILSAFFVSYFISNLFFFDALITFLPFVIVLAFLSQLSVDMKFLMSDKAGKMKKIFEKCFSKDNGRVLLGAALVLAVIGVFVNFKIAKASYYYYRIRFDANKSLDELFYFYDKVLSEKSDAFEAETTYSVSSIITKNKIDDQSLSQKMKPIMKRLDELSIDRPIDLKPYYYGAKVDLLYFDLSADKDALAQAQNLLERAIAISPNRQNFHMDLARVKMNQEDYSGAILEMEKARDLNLNYSRPHFYLSILYLLDERYQSAKSELEKAEELNIIYNKSDIPNLLYIADSFMLNKEDDGAIAILEKILGLDEQNVAARKKAAVLYAEKGDKEKARKYAMIIWNISESLRPEAENFIKYLDGK